MKQSLKFIDLKTELYSADDIDNLIGNTKPLFSFSAISDLHLGVGAKINQYNGHDDLVKLLKKLSNRIKDKNLNLKYIFSSGDIGFDASIQETGTFYEIMKQQSPIPTTNIFSCTGNHDQKYTVDQWKESMFDESLRDRVTEDKNFSFTDGDFVFAFMSLAPQDDVEANVQGRICYLNDETTNTRDWLSNVVSSAKDKTLVLFMHFPIPNRKCADTKSTDIRVYDWTTGEYTTKNVETAYTVSQYAGLIDRGGGGENLIDKCSNYGFYIKSEEQDYSVKLECEEIIDILNEHENGRTIVFSGHTHFAFQNENLNALFGKGYPNINVAEIPDTNITTVHIPSLNYPRLLTTTKIGSVTGCNDISDANPYRQPSQSYIVDVYDDKLILHGFESNVCHDNKYGDILPEYTYTIDLNVS